MTLSDSMRLLLVETVSMMRTYWHQIKTFQKTKQSNQKSLNLRRT